MTDEIGVAHHTSKKRGTYTVEWGTPEYILAPFRPIAVDLATTEEHNERVEAGQIFTEACPLLDQVLCVSAWPPGSIWCNPPGPTKNTRLFFKMWVQIVLELQRTGGFLVFNADHFRNIASLEHPLLNVTMLSKRVKYVGATHSANFPSILVSTPDVDVSGLGVPLLW